MGRNLSLPMRERGLKSDLDPEPRQVLESLPMRERGLKCVSEVWYDALAGSLPMRERGLKFDGMNLLKNQAETVAPHAGAWIEIYRSLQLAALAAVAPHAGAWIEIRASVLACLEETGRAPGGSVD